MKTVFITGADRGIGFALCQEFLLNGWQVYAGQFLPNWHALEEAKKEWKNSLELVPINVADPESVKKAAAAVQEQTSCLDMLVNVAGIAGGDSPEELKRLFRVNSIGPVCVTENFLPLMQTGTKRLCYFSSEAGSISLAHRKDSYGYGMSKAMLNMAVKLMFNTLRKKDYTFRLYHPGWVNSYMLGETMTTGGTYMPEESAKAAYRYFTEDAPCEDVLVMTDIENMTWSF